MHGSILCASAFAICLSALDSAALAQCNNVWLPGEGYPGTDLPAASGVMWDPDGGGPATPVLAIGGSFTIGGNVAAMGVATWDPATGGWGSLGSGVAGDVSSLAVASNGDLLAAAYTQGPVAGSRVWRWNGTAWATIGGLFDTYVHCMAVLPNGNIVVGGDFTNVGGVPVSRIARWDGAAWQPFGSGTPGTVDCLTVCANGDLLVGGGFVQIDGAAANCIARWNGTSWSALGTGIPQIGSDSVHAIAEAANGDIFAGGFFPTAGGVPVNNIARWNGNTWSSLLNGVSTSPTFTGSVRSLLVLPNGNLIVGGGFSSASGLTARSIAGWNGLGWFQLGPGFQQLGIGTPAWVEGLVSLPTGDFVACGSFRTGGGQFGDGVSRWDGTSWRALGSGFNNFVICVAAGVGDQFVVGGTFTIAGGVAANRVALWTGSQWQALGSGVNGQVNAAAVLPNGDVVIGGTFTAAGAIGVSRIAKWNGSAWAALGSGLNGTVNAIVADPAGGLLVGGSFTTAGGPAANHVARWTGSAWVPLGLGVNGAVAAMHVRADGTLVVGGSFSTAGGQPANSVASWNGANWSALGWLQAPNAFATMSNGDLVAATAFSIARWDGTAWTASFGTASNLIYSLTALPGGNLVAVGDFSSIGGVAAERIARWNGATWTPLGAGFDGRPLTTALLPAGRLVVGGMFTWGGGQPSPYLARIGTTCPAGSAPLGGGCPSSGGSNTLTVLDLPWIGGVFRARSTGAPALALVVGATGFSSTNVSLAALFAGGQPGCTLWASPDLLDVTVAAAGAAQLAVAIPNSVALVGQTFHHQHVPFEFDGGGALVAVTATNAVTLTIGSF